MSKICAKCTKSVYPLEELKCLDKIWHKACFRCLECGMLLNMKNYKGYNKNPYCSAHYPQTKATVVADTPELHRLTQNTKIQSQVKYHEDFEKNIKGSKIQVSDDPETERIRQVNHLVSQVEYKGGTKEKIGNLEARRQSLPPKVVAKPARVLPNNTNRLADTTDDKFSPFSARSTAHSITYNAGGERVPAPRVKRVGSIADYDPVNENYGSLGAGYKPASRQTSQSQEWEETVPLSPTSAAAQPHIVKEVDHDVNNEAVTPSSGTAKSPGFDNHNGSPKPADVDVDERNEEVPIKRQEVVEPEEEVEEIVPSPEPNNAEVEEIEARKIEHEVAEIAESVQHSNQNEVDEVTEEVVDEPDEGINVEDDNVPEEIEPVVREPEEREPEDREPDEREPEDVVPEEEDSTAEENASGIEENPVAVDEEEKIKTKPMPCQPRIKKGIFVALYDYEAQDDDEVGFVEGDQIVDCEMIDEGWMYGRVVRTGRKGMLPSNYVEQSQD